jgi:hypothetical protein
MKDLYDIILSLFLGIIVVIMLNSILKCPREIVKYDD